MLGELCLYCQIAMAEVLTGSYQIRFLQDVSSLSRFYLRLELIPLIRLFSMNYLGRIHKSRNNFSRYRGIQGYVIIP